MSLKTALKQAKNGWLDDATIGVIQKAAQRGNKAAVQGMGDALEYYARVGDEEAGSIITNLWEKGYKTKASASTLFAPSKSFGGQVTSKLESFKNALSRM